MTQGTSQSVSVVIPAYNAGAFICETLDSVRAQTYPDYEVIVVDDGSSDDTKAVVERYFERYGMIGRCIQQENKKIAGARNAGMRAARGEYIALLDHDDIWYPEKLSVVMREFELHPTVDLIWHNENVNRGGRVVRTHRKHRSVPRMYERLLFTGNALSPSACVFKTEKALSIGGFHERPDFDTVEDYDFWLRLSRVAQFHFIDQVLGEYRVVDGAASRRIDYHHTNLEKMLRDHFSAYFGDRPRLIERIRIRLRLSAVYRSAAGHLMEYDELPEKQREYVIRMLRAFPIQPKNVARALVLVAREIRGRNAGSTLT